MKIEIVFSELGLFMTEEELKKALRQLIAMVPRQISDFCIKRALDEVLEEGV